MKKVLFVTFATLAVAAAAFGALGDVVGSFAIPGGGQAGMGRSNSYLYVNNYSNSRIYSVNPTSGSIYTSFSNAGGTNTRGLAYTWGGYLYQNKAYTSPYNIYRTNEANGSIYNTYATLPTSTSHGSAPLATGDGGEGATYLFISDYSARRIYRMTLAGSIVDSFTISPQLYDIAYDWRNQIIWGGMNSGVVYGVTTTGSSVTSFSVSGPSNIYGITYHGQYLWVAGTAGNVYRVHCPGTVGVQPSSVGKIKALYK